MVNLMSPTSLLTFDTCLLLSHDGELAFPDFFAHLFDTCLLLSPDGEPAVPGFFAHL